jgi:hypothetical protein
MVSPSRVLPVVPAEVAVEDVAGSVPDPVNVEALVTPAAAVEANRAATRSAVVDAIAQRERATCDQKLPSHAYMVSLPARSRRLSPR